MRNKFKAQRTNGFSSKLESAVYDMLKSRPNVKDIKCQQAVVLVPGPRNVQIKWKVDFSAIEETKNWDGTVSDKLTYYEAKGIETSDYKLKLKLWRKNKPAPLEVWKATYSNKKINLYLHERIE